MPCCAIQVSLVPSSSLQALVPTWEASVMLEESTVRCCDPRCDAVGNCAAAVRAAAAAVAVAGGAAAVDEPPAGAEPGLELPVPGSEVRFWVSKLLRAAALLWPGPIAPPAVEEELLVGAAVAAGATAGEDIAAAIAPASACSKNASALEAGSAVGCLAAGGLDPSVSGAWDLGPEASVAVAPSDGVAAGVAASDWASAAEKSVVSAAAAVVPAAA